VSRIIQQGVIPRTIEYMDNNSIRCVETSINAGLPVDAAAILLLEVDGAPSENREALARLEKICADQGAVDIKTAESRDAADRLWRARKAVSPALYAFGPDKINEDIVVPRNLIPEMVEKIKQIGDETGLVTASFGHAGDGNIHVNIMLDKKDAGQLRKAEKAVDELFDYTLRLGGTISGEHGIGITKSDYMTKEIGAVEMALMKSIKAVFDPFNILNPGKIFSPGK
jgi:glycolate oxidase